MLKEILKRNTPILKTYRFIFSSFIAILVRLTPTKASKILYKKNTGKKLNLDNPSDFNEKIHWLKLYWQHPLVSTCGDKYEVRSYAEEKGCSNLLNEIYGVYEDSNEINWGKLPHKFVLKVTSGCGFNIICKDKSKLNIEEVNKQLNKWLKINYSLKNAELHYSKMKPRIICEKFIESNSGILPVDYKIYCFNGEPKFVLVTPERETGYKRFMFDINWEPVDFEKNKSVIDLGKENIKKPESFMEMIETARILAEPFPFVRVDYYDDNGKAILGEMTFTPAAGMANYYDDKFLLKMGDLIKLPNRIR